MTKLPLLALIALSFAAACRDKEAPKQKVQKSEPAAPVSDGKWLQRLPRSESAVKVSLDTVAGIVELEADGTVRIAPTPPAGTTDPLAKAAPSARDAVANGLGLPPVAKRQAPALEVEGSAAGSDAANPIDELFAGLAHPMPATGAPDAPPSRLTSAFAIAHPNDVSAGVVVFADPKAPAAALVELLAQTGGFVAVHTEAGLGALPLAFDRQEPPQVAPYKPWLEIQAGDATQLASTFGGSPDAAPDRLRELVQSKGTKALDVLVGPKTTVGDLVSTLQLANAAGIEAVGLGPAVDAADPNAAKRSAAGPRVLAWDFFMQGMDKTDPAPFRAALDAALPSMLDCYKQAVVKKPAAGGATHVELIVKPDGKVGDVAAPAGPLAKDLAACATGALEKATFPAIAAPTKMGLQLAFVTAAIAGSPAPSSAGPDGSAGSAGSAGSGSAK